MKIIFEIFISVLRHIIILISLFYYTILSTVILFQKENWKDAINNSLPFYLTVVFIWIVLSRYKVIRLTLLWLAAFSTVIILFVHYAIVLGFNYTYHSFYGFGSNYAKDLPVLWHSSIFLIFLIYLYILSPFLLFPVVLGQEWNNRCLNCNGLKKFDDKEKTTLKFIETSIRTHDVVHKSSIPYARDLNNPSEILYRTSEYTETYKYSYDIYRQNYRCRHCGQESMLYIEKNKVRIKS